MGNEKLAIHGSIQCITFPSYFCKITETTNELIDKVFQNLPQNYRIRQYLNARVILIAKTYDVYTIILNEIRNKTT
jgi:hypothetical protein